MASFLAKVYRNGFRQFTVDIFESNGTTEALLAAGDVAVVRIGRKTVSGYETALQIRSGEVSDGDSTITYTNGDNTLTVNIGAVDVAELTQNFYQVDVFVLDASDTDSAGSPRQKYCEQGVLFVAGTLPEPLELQSSSSSESSNSSSS